MDGIHLPDTEGKTIGARLSEEQRFALCRWNSSRGSSDWCCFILPASGVGFPPGSMPPFMLGCWGLVGTASLELGENRGEEEEVQRRADRQEAQGGTVRNQTALDDQVLGELGERQLLCLRIKDHEGVAALKVHCPSTGNSHYLRIPPWMESCGEAVAWVAGLPSDQYGSVVET